MKIFMKYIARNIKDNKLRGGLILLSLMISTFVLFLNFVVRDDLLYKYEELHKESYHGYDLIVSYEDDENPFFKENDFNTKDVNLNDKLSSILSFGVIDNEDLLTVKLYGCDRKSYLNSGLIAISNKDKFDINKDEQIIISPQLAKNYGFKLGDKIPIQTQIGVKEYKIGAIGEETGLFLGVDNENLILMTDSEVETITDQKSKINSLLLSLEDSSDIKATIKTIKANNENFNIQALVNQDTVEASVNMMSQILVIILVLAIILNYYVISSNAKVILLSRIPVVGTFRSTGASKRTVNLILIIENFLYGIVGGSLGVICGILFREPIMRVLGQSVSGVSMSTLSAPINYTYMIMALLFAIVIQLISVLHTIYEIGNYAIKNLIFGEFNSIQKISKTFTILGFIFLGLSYVLYRINLKYNIILSILALVISMIGGILILPLISKCLSFIFSKINKLIFGSASSLGARNISDSKIVNSNIKLVVISITVVLMMFITSLSIGNLLENAENVFEADIQIYGMGKKEDEYLKLKKVDGVEDIKFLYGFWDTFNINGKDLNLQLLGFEDEGYGVKNIEGNIKDIKNGEVMIDEFYAIQNGFKVGDILEIKSDNIKGKNLKVKIVGSIDSSSLSTTREIIIFSKEQLKRDINDIPINIYVESSRNLDKMKKTLYRELSGEDITVQTIDEFLGEQEDMVGSILSIVWIFLILSILLSAIGLINNQVIGFMQRRREYAILHSVAMSKTQLNIMIFFETMNSFLIGCLSGLVLSLWMSRLMLGLLSSIGMHIELNFQWLKIFGAVGVIFIVLILTAFIPMYKILKMNIVEEIKYE